MILVAEPSCVGQRDKGRASYEARDMGDLKLIERLIVCFSTGVGGN